jgi:kynureninase
MTRDSDPAPEIDVERWRDEFPILSETVYMISNSLGAMPARARDDLAEYAETWATRGVRAWEEGWWEMAAGTGDRIGAIVGAPAGSVCMQENVTTALMTVLSSLSPRPGRRAIVSTEMDFPSALYLYRAQQAAGMELRLVPAEPDLSVRTERILDAIDASTLVVSVSHVLFRNSWILDARAIVEKARRVGAPVILDVYQSAGIVPLDLTALGVDYAVGGCLKWLCGGPGTGFLYARPDRLASTTPRFTGWLAHREPFAFEGELRSRDDASKLMNGTPAIPAFYAARAGLEIVREAGVEAIRARSKRMTAHLMQRIDALGFSFTASRDPERVAGTVALDVPDARFVARTLKRHDFLVDYRPRAGIRISPHFYNTFEELDAVLDETARTVRERDYDLEEPFASGVT